MARTYKPGGVLHTLPAAKGMTVWHVHDDVSDMAWAYRDDGTVWNQEPLENLVVLQYFPPE